MPIINSIKTQVLTMNKKGELQNAYTPLQNFINSNNQLGDFTSKKLNFDRYTPIDMIITDEYDGSENIIINDDKNSPRLINSRFSVQENNTFNIPVHQGNTTTNIYEEDTFEKDTQLLKLYDNIPELAFLGISNGGEFKCGSYVFYFKLADADNNQTNIIQESGIVQMHIGSPNSRKVRMGMQDENSEKSVQFLLSGIDNGFDYVKIFYERSSTDSSQALTTSYFMINDNYPIENGKCRILLTGAENTLQISKSDIQNEFADIQTAKTQAIVDNTLFLGNVSAYEQDYAALQQLAWKIIPSIETSNTIGKINASNYSVNGGSAYYDVNNVYYNTGYWGEEYYRFGIVFIYNNNILSPVFNIQGCDLTKQPTDEDFFNESDKEHYTSEPEDFIFNKEFLTNSKGVVKLPKADYFKGTSGNIEMTPMKIKFDFSKIVYSKYDPESIPIELTILKGKQNKIYELFKSLNIKGFFMVRQKRIPTIIAQGMVIGLTGKDYGAIPVLQNLKKTWITKSFLNQGRILQHYGSTVHINDKNVKKKALLVPDYDINEATLNQIFTGQEFQLEKIYEVTNKIIGDHHFSDTVKESETHTVSDVRLTAVPKETKIKTDGENYFSTRAGNPDEPYKTSDVNYKWNETPPQTLTASTSLIRGNWGSFVGMSYDGFEYGDVVNIRLNDFKDLKQNEIEFQKRFKDFSLYSAISPRYNISYFKGQTNNLICGRGDCFTSLFTHRMMSNFIDPELPTNHQIIDPACWAKNYGVRCTAEILTSTHSNLTSDSDGWYIPQPQSKKSAIVSLIFGILTANVGTIINSVSDLTSSQKSGSQDKYANEIVQAFEVYIGKSKKSSEDNSKMLGFGHDSEFEEDDDQITQGDSIEELVRDGHIRKVNPKEQEQSGGLNLKAIFKSDDKWELHGLASINRADVNAVSFGSWITFPICSKYNLAFRDIDFQHATEEASQNKKRAFYPWEAMDPENHLLESGIINRAAKKSLSTNQNPAYTTVPYIKQEFFNRIYWSKPNVSEAFINSYRIIFKDQFREYNKEFGAITKILPLGNSLLVVFQHGIGTLPVNRSPQNEQEQSPWLSSKSVLPGQVATLTKDYGSMWKDSVLQTPSGMIYGVDTVAKKIWRVQPNGQGLEFISDHKVSKFLNDWIDLSEYDFNTYQGHINVKTHYNEFKHDVIFTYYKDIPMTCHKFNDEGIIVENKDDKGKLIWKPVDLSGNLILEKTVDPKPLIDRWDTGKTWSLCFNEVNNNFVTFYDWYPVESCNVDNIFFSFDKEAIDRTLENKNSVKIIKPDSNTIKGEKTLKINKVFMDKAFTNNVEVYTITKEWVPPVSNQIDNYISYYKFNSEEQEQCNYPIKTRLGLNKDWILIIAKVNEEGSIIPQDSKIADVHSFYLPDGKFKDTEGVFRYQEARDTDGEKMYLYKHGQAGLYDNQGKIKPTFWYDNQHEFNFEFVINEAPQIQKIFNNLKIVSNKTAPNKFEYEVVGESYDWYNLKPIILWINKHAEDKTSFENYYKEVLSTPYNDLVEKYPDFPYVYEYEGKTIQKLPFLHIETADKHGRKDKSYHQYDPITGEGIPDNWNLLNPDSNKDYKYTFNTSETIVVEDDQLNEQRVHTESLGNDMKKYGRVRGNMQYLEDLWDVEIRPIKFKWAYLQNKDADLSFISSKEARHRDKFIKIRIRYSGEDLAVLQQIITMFEYSYA